MGTINPNSGNVNPAPKAPATPNSQPNQAGLPNGPTPVQGPRK